MVVKLLKLPLPYYGPDDESGSAKTEAQRQRDSIKVTSGTSKQEPEKEEEKDVETEVSEDATDKEETEETEEEGEETEEGDEEKPGEEKELTVEQKQIQALERKLERLQKRVGKTAGERDAIKKELKDTKASLEAKVAEGTQPLTEEEVNRRARELANQELTAKEFNDAQERLIRAATKEDKNFMSKINDLAVDVAPLPAFFIGALDDLDNGGEVLNYLSDNADEYEDLISMNRPTKVIKGLVEISNKLIEAKKPKPKKVSDVPNPPKAPGGNRKSPDTLPPKPTENMAEFVRVRNLQVEARRKAKMGG